MSPRLPRPAAIDRSSDRRVTAGGLAISAAFLVLAGAATGVPNLRGRWLPLHLVLAGAATVAIGSVMPFFASTLVAAPPAPARLRLGIIGLLAAGALGATVGYGTADATIAVTGGLLFLAGLVLLLGLIVSVLRGSARARLRVFAAAYGVAVVNVVIGVSLAVAFLIGSTPVVTDWAALMPAHAWLNLFGFAGLVICATLLHLYPTVVGARIAHGRLVLASVVALTLGPDAVAAGYASGVGAVAQAGAAFEVAGTIAILAYAARAWRTRGHWTTDAAWHEFAIGSLSAGLGWLAVGVGIAVARIAVRGADPAGWTIGPLIAPLGIGFVVQVLVGSWTHLLPSIGPGGPVSHARARSALGRAARPRLLALNAGAAVLLAGNVEGWEPGVPVGLGLVAIALLAAVVVFGLALREVGWTGPDARRSTGAGTRSTG